MARNKNRKSPEINSSSMADIAFLLLIFFLVTTTIASDKGLMMTLPPKPDPNAPPPDVSKNQRNIFKVQVNSLDKILVEDEPVSNTKDIREKAKAFILNFGKANNEEVVSLYNSLPVSLKAISKRSPESSDNPKEAVISFKADRGTSYDKYIAILDELQGAFYEIYGERVGLTADEFRALDTKKDSEKAIYEKGRDGIPMNISIAEPTKVGGE